MLWMVNLEEVGGYQEIHELQEVQQLCKQIRFLIDFKVISKLKCLRFNYFWLS